MKPACILTATLALLMGATARGDEASEAAGYLKKAYPPAEKGMTRFAIILPKLENESNFKVELIVGRKMTVDSANTASLGGSIDEVNIEGWGFSRYVVKRIGEAAQTLIGGGMPEERFVTMPSRLVRYNSRLPIAVYVPEGAEVKYRIWSTTSETKDIPKR
jgi:ecotin